MARPARARPARHVARDVALGYLSPEAASEAYGDAWREVEP
jgi:N-methylhydantoinase B